MRPQFKTEKNEEKDPVRSLVKNEEKKELKIEAFQYQRFTTQPKESAGATHSDDRFKLNALQKHSLGLDESERAAQEEFIQKELESRTKEAFKRGFDQGRLEGFQKGFDESVAKFSKSAGSSLEMIRVFAESCESAKHILMSENEKYLVNLVFQISKGFFLKEVSQDQTYCVRLLKELIDRYEIRDNLKLKLNAKDLENIKPYLPEFEKRLGEAKNIQLELSPTVTLGGCVIETDWATIDAKIETQIAQIEASLKGKE